MGLYILFMKRFVSRKRLMGMSKSPCFIAFLGLNREAVTPGSGRAKLTEDSSTRPTFGERSPEVVGTDSVGAATKG
jgi:hypothetical protein